LAGKEAIKKTSFLGRYFPNLGFETGSKPSVV
jgi:hypothetical protein